ncbi:unnamed protein product [Nippostrongylus brasiliensis]|uniref:PH domain-containing protein n=1 Tax=Nippostrongylus brasiliensis TaxID=27835 RepID=A0A0N4YMG0_NIPBR|nr:unnamed protein product [Nippostrongylus brasiliensis]
MHRSRATVDSAQSGGEEVPPKQKESGGSRRQRWSFAFRRRWFSTSARDLKTDHHSGLDSPTSPGLCDAAGILISPRQTKLGSSWHSDAPSSSCTDRPDAGGSGGVVKRKSLRNFVD